MFINSTFKIKLNGTSMLSRFRAANCNKIPRNSLLLNNKHEHMRKPCKIESCR